MLYFCEDCGERNFLEPEVVQNGKVVFRCRVCNYLNNVEVAGPPADDPPPRREPPPAVDQD